MRAVLFSTTFFLLFSSMLMGQPGNDDCTGLIELGPVPACPDDIFTNVDATATDIGFGNAPSCFNGGGTQNDVWFSFQTTTDLVDLSIFVTGALDGPNGSPLTNPQIALYRGSCEFNGLAELACFSAPNGDALARLDILGLTPNETYFIRINDYSASATPNWGDFQLCVDEFVPEVNMGDSDFTTACFGTLFDSGGPDNDYSDGENLTFTICPNDPHFCINIDLIDFVIEQGFDNLNFYAGTDVSAPLVATATGSSNGEFPIEISSPCVTIQFTSDGSAVQSGFELTWQCTPLSCDGSTIDNPSVINAIPFSTSGESTCEGAATFAASPCNDDAFLGGPETVFIYDSPGGLCAQIEVTNAAFGTGVIVLDGPPDDPDATCVGQSASGFIGSANFQDPGTYYIVVANPFGCTTFDLDITESDCQISSSLADALCNPLNGCIEDGGVPSVFNFEDGFQDINVETDINGGCWLGFGAQPDFIWFTIQSQADGPFGFVLESADNPSDIDFNVWGPFSEDDVCENQADVINFIENNQPIRSSWAGGADPTGLANVHPVLGTDVTDEYDCGAAPGAGGDDFVSVINTQVGEIYVVLINDWGNNVGDAGISVDWGPSQPDVLAPVPIEVMGGDTAVCAGQPVQLLIDTPIDNIQWFGDTATLSCTFCADPVATPDQTTIYKAVVDAVCYTDTVEIQVEVFDVDAGPDLSVCRNLEFDIEAGSDFPNATYEWSAPAEVILSCTDCPVPTVTGTVAGTYTLSVTLNGPDCTVSDEMELIVLPEDAPEFDIIDDIQICEEDPINLGGPPTAGVTYSWSSNPVGFTSDESNPQVTPSETTTYYLTVEGGNCPLPILDSVVVTVFDNPVINLASEMAVCQGDTISLGATEIEDDVTYVWTGPEEILDPADPNTQAVPQADGVYTLTANRGVCVTTGTVPVSIVEIAVDVTPNDTVMICKGEEVNLNAAIVPENTTVTWTPNDGSLSSNTGTSVVATPQVPTIYTATVEEEGCIRTDQITILVDSLPTFLDIMPADTMICQGELVVLTSQIFEPSDFPDIEFQWEPLFGSQSQDTLFNYVVQPDSTTTYIRTATNGLCTEMDSAVVNVTPVTAISVMPDMSTICEGESVQLNVVFDAGELEEVEWTPTAGLSCTDCEDPVATPESSIVYNVTAEFMGCPVAASSSITVIDAPEVALNPNNTICLGDAIQLNLNSDDVSEYVWTSPDDPDFTSTDPLLTVSPTATTTYELAATNSCGTFDYSITVQVVTEPSLMLDDLNLVECANEMVTLNANSDAPAFVAETYTWNINGNIEMGESVSLDGYMDSLDVVFTYTYGTEQEVCGEFTESGSIFLAPAPQLDVPDQIDLCLGDSTFLNNNPDPDLTTYTWLAPGFSSNDPNPWVGPTETTTYLVTAETPGCDQIIDSVIVTVTPMVEMSLGEDFSVGMMDSVIVIPDIAPTGNFPDDYDWSWGFGETSSEPTIGLESIEETTTFVLNYSYGPGCGTVTDTLVVSLIDVGIPNVFTPNNDNVNDVFQILHNGGNIEVSSFKVFNRWGQVVYEARDNNGWDGRQNGSESPSDVYIYHLVFKVDDVEFDEHGDLTLLR